MDLKTFARDIMREYLVEKFRQELADSLAQALLDMERCRRQAFESECEMQVVIP